MNKQEIMREAMRLYPTDMMNEMFGPAKDVNDRDRNKFIEGALWMQQNQSGMRWIRASERDIPSYQTIARFVHTKAILMNAQSFLTLMPDQKPLIEWLDESASSEVERLREENEELNDLLKEICEILKRSVDYSVTANIVRVTDIHSIIKKIEAK